MKQHFRGSARTDGDGRARADFLGVREGEVSIIFCESHVAISWREGGYSRRIAVVLLPTSFFPFFFWFLIFLGWLLGKRGVEKSRCCIN